VPVAVPGGTEREKLAQNAGTEKSLLVQDAGTIRNIINNIIILYVYILTAGLLLEEESFCGT
jgi:hypothetical protein